MSYNPRGARGESGALRGRGFIAGPLQVNVMNPTYTSNTEQDYRKNTRVFFLVMTDRANATPRKRILRHNDVDTSGIYAFLTAVPKHKL